MNKKTKKEIKAIYQEIARLDSLIHESKEKPTKEPINSLHDYEVKGDIELKHKIKFPDVKETEIDWNVPGQIVEKTDTGLIVMTTGESYNRVFSGIVLEAKFDWVVGDKSDSWCKKRFKLSNKTLKLE